jgi:hypothetical protein
MNALEAMDILDPRNHIDIFCLHQVFIPVIQVTMDRFYLALRNQLKRRSTKNPNYPAGTFFDNEYPCLRGAWHQILLFLINWVGFAHCIGPVYMKGKCFIL